MILLLFLLFTKHLIFDFFYQPPYQWQNKGTYGHLGGILHSGQHALATFVLTLFFVPVGMAVLIALFEFIVHYHMDWFKMWYNKRKGWGANTHAEFWYLMGIDQYVHTVTYLAIAYFVLTFF